jgi:hypothetical protein
MNPMSLTPMGTQSAADKPANTSSPTSDKSSQGTEFNNLFNTSLEQHSTPNGSNTESAPAEIVTAAITTPDQGGQTLPETGIFLPPVEPEGVPVTTPVAEGSLENLLAGGLQTLASLESVPIALPVDSSVEGSQISQPPILASGIVPLNTLGTSLLTENGTILANGVTVTSTPVITPTLTPPVNTDNAQLKAPTPTITAQTVVPTTDSSLNQQASSGDSDLTGQQSRSSLPVAEFSLPDVNDKQEFRFIEKQLMQPSKDILGAAATPTPDAVTKLTPEGLKTLGASYQLQQPLHQPSWKQEFGNRMVWLAKEGIQTAQLRLNPASLGKIDIKISIQNDQANISFISQHGAVKDVIDASLPRLREMMNEAGVKLDQVNVSTQANAQEQKQSSGTQAGLSQGSTRDNQHEELETLAEEDIRPVITEMHSAVDYYA